MTIKNLLDSGINDAVLKQQANERFKRMVKEVNFGLSFAKEEELDSYKRAENFRVQAESNKSRVDQLYDLAMHLLNTLKMEPEKAYILWPDRAARVQEYIAMVNQVAGK